VEADRERLERRLAQVAAYRMSGLKATAWAAANGVELRELQSWCSHAGRWRARLDGVAAAVPLQAGGFVGVRVPVSPAAPAAASIRVELSLGAGRFDLYWPVSHARELAT
jgi:hypothetical protein